MVLWIFGYGSLIWTPDFHYEERVTGYVRDYRRTFARSCNGEDGEGRGGVGLNLEPEEGAVTGGIAYRVTAEVEQQIVSLYLKAMQLSTTNACKALMLDFFTAGSPDVPALTNVMTYSTPPGKSTLWHVVFQEDQVQTTAERKLTSDRKQSVPVYQNERARMSKRYRSRCRERLALESRMQQSA